MAGTMAKDWEGLDEARAWLAERIGSPRSWIRREPLPQRPLIVIAVAAAGGVAASRYFFSVPGWYAVAGLSLAAWLWLVWRRRWQGAGLALLVAVAAAMACWSSVRWSLFAADDLAWSLGDAPVPLAIEAFVVEPPRLLADASPSPRRAGPALPPTTACVIAVRRVRDGEIWRQASGRAVLSTIGSPPLIGVGDCVRVFGRGLRPAAALNPGELDPREQARADRCLSLIRVRSADSIRVIEAASRMSVAAAVAGVRARGRAVLESCLAPRRSGLAAALLLGERAALDRADAQLFAVTGTAHILSISGLHVSILAYAVCRLLQLLPIRRRSTLLAAVGITGCYLLLVGPQTPVVRATLVVWLACLAAARGRRSHGMTALAAALVAVLIWRPAELFQTGAQLSFLATAVLITVADLLSWQTHADDPIARLIERSRGPTERRLRRFGSEMTSLFIAGFAVWMVTAPIVAARFHVVSPVAVFVNPLIAPLVALAMGWGFLCLVTACVSQTVACACGWMCDGTLACLTAVAEVAADLPGAYAWVAGPPEWWVMGWYACLVVAVLWIPRDRLRQPLTWGLLAGGWMIIGGAGGLLEAAAESRPMGLRMVAASMGHGCGVVVRSPGGRCLVYDAGRLGAPGAARRAMEGVLWDEGLAHIDTLVISHADADHFNAVPDLIERFSIGEMIVSDAFLRHDTAAVGELLLLARQARIPIRTVAAGDSFPLDATCRVRVLHPRHRDAAARRTERRIADNEASIVMAVEAAGRRLLLTGDLEGAALATFVATGPDACDVLVAPHHGSVTSMPPDIAQATTPEVVVVSGPGGRRWADVKQAYATARVDGNLSTVIKTGGWGALRIDLTTADITMARCVAGRWQKVSLESLRGTHFVPSGGRRGHWPGEGQPSDHDHDLTRDVASQQHEYATGEAVTVQPDPQLIGAKPAPGGDDVATDGEQGKATRTNPAIPAGVKDRRVPEHDHERSVLFGIPAPEAAPTVVGPQAAQHRADETEEESEADHTVGHPIKTILDPPAAVGSVGPTGRRPA
jgi:competence protein ComEC